MSEYLSKDLEVPQPINGMLMLSIVTSVLYAPILQILEKPEAQLENTPTSVKNFEAKSSSSSNFYYWTANFFVPEKDKRYKPAFVDLNPSEFWSFYVGLKEASQILKNLENSHPSSRYTKVISDVFRPTIFVQVDSEFSGISLHFKSRGAHTYHLDYSSEQLDSLLTTLHNVFKDGSHLVNEMNTITPLKIKQENFEMESMASKKKVSLFAKFIKIMNG